MVPTRRIHAVSVHLLWRSLLCLIFISFTPVSFAADDSRFTSLSQLFQPSNSHEYQFSPNGQHLAYIDAQAALNTIVVSTLGRHKQSKRIVLKGTAPNKLHWLNANIIVYEAEGRLMSIDCATMSHKLLLDNLNYVRPNNRLISSYDNAYRDWQLVNTLPQEPQNLIVAAKDKQNNSYIYRYNFVENRLDEIANGRSGGISDWIVARNGKVSLGLINEQGRETYLAKSGNKWSASKAPLMFDFDGESYLNRRAVFESVSYNEDIVYVSENFSTDKFRITAYSLSQNKPLNTVLEDNYYDIGGDENPAQLLFNDRTKKLAGIHYDRDKPHSVWFDKTLAAMQRSLNTRFPDAVNRIESWTPDMQKVLVKSYDATARHKVYLYYPFRQKLELLSDFSGTSDTDAVAATQTFRFKARDGYELEGYLTLPKNTDAAPVPLVVIPHGGPWARDTWTYDADSQFFAAQGYATLKVNFRGSRGYGLAHLRAGIGELAGLMIDDIADGAYWAINNNITKANSVSIMGASYGGYAALMSGVRYPNLYQGVVSKAAPIDLLNQFEHFQDNDLGFAYNYWQQAVGDPLVNAAFLAEISPKAHLAKLSLPTLIYHGAEDQTVPVWQATLAEKSLQRNKKAKVIIVANEGHGFTQIENRLEYLNAAKALFSSAEL